MTFEASLFIAFFIIAASIVVVSAMAASRRQAAQEEELKRAASARGWKFDVSHEGGYRVKRWTGTTDGIAWVAEYLYRSGGKNNSSRHIARWHCTFTPGINAPLVAMGLPNGKEMLGASMINSEGFFAQMAQKAVGFVFDKALDVYFGDEAGKQVDAGAMHRVDGEKIPGFIVMAADKDEASRILAQGLEKALLDAASDRSSVMSEEKRPWVLLRPHAISLARMTAFREVAEIERFTAAGIALTRAFKFGRVSV